jgi:endonuclease/exonuclease/phosphatase (EEP) superfamily protein YafD
MSVASPLIRPVLRTRRRRGWHLPLLVAVLLWLVIGALAVAAILRLVAWDDFQPFAVLNDVTLFVYLPAWVVAVVATLGRRLLLAGAALLIVLAQVSFLLPELLATQPVPAWAGRAPTLRLFDANVYSNNQSMAGYVNEIRTAQPQLVTMEEINPDAVGQMVRSGSLVGLPNQLDLGRYDPWGFFVASKYPLSGTRVVYLYRRPLIVQTTLALPSGPQPLWVIHTVAPLAVSFSQWQGQLTLIDRLLRARRPAGLLVVGDFNATWGSRGFRSILDLGLTDGAAARGEALGMTWSQVMSFLPPLVRIDHVLTGSGLAVTQIKTEPGPGSDHRALLATVAVNR